MERPIRAAVGVEGGAARADQTFDGNEPMTERPTRHLTLVKSGGRAVGRDAITLPAPVPMARAQRIAERTLLLYCPEQAQSFSPASRAIPRMQQ